MLESTPKRVAVLIENLFDAAHWRVLQEALAVANAEPVYLSNLWGYDSLLFTGDDVHCAVEVRREVSTASPDEFQGLVLLGGYAMDRLRYQLAPVCGSPNQAPAVEFLRAAVAAMEAKQLTIGAIGHGLQLFCAAPETLRGRQVTCGHNLIQEVTNAGATVMFQGNRTADIHQEGGLLTARDTSVAPALFASFVAQL
jgi:protease I